MAVEEDRSSRNVSRRTVRIGGVAVAVLLGVIGAGCGHGPSALSLSTRPTPPFRVPHYRTSGTYPYVFGGKADLRPVNRAIRAAVLRAQREYGRFVHLRQSDGPEWFRPQYPYWGRYETEMQRPLASASTVVVSALVPVLELLPGGNDGSTWLSVTVRVPSGAPVRLRDLFAEPARGLSALAILTRNRVLATNECVRASIDSPLSVDAGTSANSLRGFAPTAANYRYFALTTKGLAIGFPNGQVGGPVCGRIEAVVSYSALGPYLSDVAKRLIAGVRDPKG